MEGDSHVKKNKKKNIESKRSIFDVSNVLSTTGIRLGFQIINGLEWLILDGRYYILFNFRVFLGVIYLLYEMVKE
jgi:hypothetical protein